MSKSYKIVIIGDSGIGKTSLVKRLRLGSYDKKHLATLGAEVTNIEVDNNGETINLLLWDTAGNDNLAGLGDGYYIGAKAAIIMTSDNSPTPIDSLAR